MGENKGFIQWFKGLSTGDQIKFGGVVVAIMGLLLSAYSILRTEPRQDLLHKDSKILAEQIYEDLRKTNEENGRLREGMHSKEDEIAALKDIIEDLRKPRKTQEETDLATKAEIELAKGNVEAAKGFYADEVKRNLKDSNDSKLKAAENYRRIGALDFMNNPKEAVKAYEKSVELDPDNVVGWNRLGVLHKLLGNLKLAGDAFNEVLQLSNSDKSIKAVAYGNLGVIRQTQGDLEGAEEFQLKALEIDKELGSKEGMAIRYGNLGLIRKTQGDLEGAEELYLKALDVFKELGHKEGMAAAYGNLGVIRQTQGDLEGAEEFQLKALEIDKELGRKEGMAIRYGNLGLIRKTQGDLEGAEEFQLKALEIDKELGRKEGMAIRYGNLGLIRKTQGDLEAAKDFWQKSLALYKQIGAAPMIEKVQGWLDELEDNKDS
ncbi:tetratricopeptide repeat protein [Maridesulfovibrio sp.]|uniref:tetratricopeptide repeat protein n=1 Tax=Maridesulfovibrio sp. TaxID=2795000 RepID=UPI0039F12E82